MFLSIQKTSNMAPQPNDYDHETDVDDHDDGGSMASTEAPEDPKRVDEQVKLLSELISVADALNDLGLAICGYTERLNHKYAETARDQIQVFSGHVAVLLSRIEACINNTQCLQINVESAERDLKDATQVFKRWKGMKAQCACLLSGSPRKKQRDASPDPSQ